MSKCRWELGPVELGDRGYDSIKISSTYTVFCCFTFDRFVHLIALHAVVCGHFISIRDHRLTRWVSECVLNNLRCNFSFFRTCMFVMTLIMAKEVESYNWKRTHTHIDPFHMLASFSLQANHTILLMWTAIKNNVWLRSCMIASRLKSGWNESRQVTLFAQNIHLHCVPNVHNGKTDEICANRWITELCARLEFIAFSIDRINDQASSFFIFTTSLAVYRRDWVWIRHLVGDNKVLQNFDYTIVHCLSHKMVSRKNANQRELYIYIHLTHKISLSVSVWTWWNEIILRWRS